MTGKLEDIHWRQLAIFIAALIAIQLAYWLAIHPLSGADRATLPATAEIVGASIARLDTPSFAAAAKTQHTTAELPFTHCCDTAVFSAKLQFKLDTVPAEGLGVISTLQVDNYRLAVNGSTLFAQGSLTPGAVTFDGQRTLLTRIPAGVLRPGINELHYITVRDGFPYTDILPPLIADYDALDA